jgi:hypothetical protein
MSRGGIASTVACLVLLTLLNLWFWRGSGLEHWLTSLDHGPAGHAAVYDLLSELGYEVRRSYAPPAQLPGDQLVWLIAPRPQQASGPIAPPVIEELGSWLEAGGRAVVFGGPAMDWSPLGLEVVHSEGTEFSVAAGGISTEERVLAIPMLRHFSSPESFEVVASDGRGRVLAVEVRREAGLLVAVADHRFLENRRLPEADGAVLAVDLVRAYGAPWIDERFHGLRESRALTEVLGGARLGLLLLLCVLLLVVIAERRRWPARVLSESEGPEPNLRAFVESLARHYLGTRDYPEIFDAYREGFKHRLRSQRFGDGQLSEGEFAEKLEADPALGAESRLWLLGSSRPTSSRELLRAVRALERFAEARR